MKVLVVEDEHPIRESLIRSLQRLGYDETFEAADGIEALDWIKSIRPDIVLVDIKMPRMDGIQFISEAKNHLNDAVFIIISGFDTFEYAQKAISLGVFAYLLKPVNNLELENVMNKVVENLTESKVLQERNVNDSIMNRRYLSFARRNFILELVHGKIADEVIIANGLDELDIKLYKGAFIIISINIDNFEEITSRIPVKDLELFKFSIENIACEILSEADTLTYSFDIDRGQGFLVSFSSNDPMDPESLLPHLHKIRDAFHEYFDLTVTIGAGEPVLFLSQLNKSFVSANKAVMLRLMKGGNQVFIDHGKGISSPAKSVSIEIETEQKLILYLKTSNKTDAMKLISSLYATVSSSSTDKAENLMKLNFQLIYIIYRIMEQMGLRLEENLGSEIDLYNQANALSSLSSILEFFSSLLEKCIKMHEARQIPWNNKILEKATDFIEKHYNQDISVGTTAEHINLSVSHFSRLFKEEHKESFVDYLTKFRINKALGYLHEGKFTVSEVSKMVGFNDEKYFHRAFKKATGKTPGNYRKS